MTIQRVQKMASSKRRPNAIESESMKNTYLCFWKQDIQRKIEELRVTDLLDMAFEAYRSNPALINSKHAAITVSGDVLEDDTDASDSGYDFAQHASICQDAVRIQARSRNTIPWTSLPKR